MVVKTQSIAVFHRKADGAERATRRTNEEKRRAVIELLSNPEWQNWSNNEIARQCSVSKGLVTQIRRERADKTIHETSYITKHGTLATMRTSKINAANRQRATLPAAARYAKYFILHNLLGALLHLLADQGNALIIPEAPEVRVAPLVGTLYLVHYAEVPDFFKIGITGNLNRRLRGLLTSTPYEVVLDHSITVANYAELEKELHARFADKRVRREWFRLTAEDVAYIKSLK